VVERVSALCLRGYTGNQLLRDIDAASMAHSLEVRVPLLDHRIAEFVGGLPIGLKSRPGVSKALLVEALSGLLPEAVLAQPKRTFTLPWQVWLRGPLGVRVSQDLANLTPPLQKYMNPRAVRGAWQNFVIGQTSWSRPWSLFVLNDWVHRHITEAAAGATSAEKSPPAIAVATAGTTPGT